MTGDLLCKAKDDMGQLIFALLVLTPALIWGGTITARGDYKTALTVSLLFWSALLLCRLSTRALVYICLALLTIPGRALFYAGGWAIRAVDILLPLTAGRIAAVNISAHKRLFHRPIAPFYKYLGLFFVVGLLSLFKSHAIFGTAAFFSSAVSFYRFWVFFLICLCLPEVIRNRSELKKTVFFLAGLGLFHAACGVLDSLLYRLGLQRWITAIYDFAGQSHINRFSFAYRVGGLQFSPENLGIMLGYLLPCLLLAAAESTTLWNRWTAGTLALGATVLEALARCGLLLMFYFSCGFICWGRFKNKTKTFLAAALALFLAGALASPHFFRRITDVKYLLEPPRETSPWSSVQALKDASEVWQSSWRVYMRGGEYLTGSGWATIDKRFSRYAYPGSFLDRETLLRDGMSTARNTYLQFLHDTGAAGLLAFCAAWLTAALLAWKLRRRARDCFGRNLALAVFLFLAVRACQNMYGVMLVRGDTYTILSLPWVYLGLLAALYRLEKKRVAWC